MFCVFLFFIFLIDFGEKDELFLFQNPCDPDVATEYVAPSEFAVSMMNFAEKEMCIAVYSMHENRRWDLFTNMIERKLQNNGNIVFRIVCHANKYCETIIDRLRKIQGQVGNKSRLQVRYTVGLVGKGASSNGNNHGKLWIADDEIAMQGSLNVSEAAFTLNMENATGYKDHDSVKQVKDAFESIWKVSTQYHGEIQSVSGFKGFRA